MIKDLIFVLMVLSMSVYAHSNKNEIVSFMDIQEEEEEIFIDEEEAKK